MTTMTQEDIREMRAYLDNVEEAMRRGHEIVYSHFADWIYRRLVWTEEKVRRGWAWLRARLGF